MFQVALSDHYESATIVSIVPLVYIFVVILHHLIMRFRRQTGSQVHCHIVCYTPTNTEIVLVLLLDLPRLQIKIKAIVLFV